MSPRHRRKASSPPPCPRRQPLLRRSSSRNPTDTVSCGGGSWRSAQRLSPAPPPLPRGSWLAAARAEVEHTDGGEASASTAPGGRPEAGLTSSRSTVMRRRTSTAAARLSGLVCRLRSPSHHRRYRGMITPPDVSGESGQAPSSQAASTPTFRRFCRPTAVELRMGGRPASAPILWVDGVAGLW